MSIHEYGQKLSFTQGYLKKKKNDTKLNIYSRVSVPHYNSIWLQNTILSSSPVIEAFICREYTLNRSANLI